MAVAHTPAEKVPAQPLQQRQLQPQQGVILIVSSMQKSVFFSRTSCVLAPPGMRLAQRLQRCHLHVKGSQEMRNQNHACDAVLWRLLQQRQLTAGDCSCRFK